MKLEDISEKTGISIADLLDALYEYDSVIKALKYENTGARVRLKAVLDLIYNGEYTAQYDECMNRDDNKFVGFCGDKAVTMYAYLLKHGRVYYEIWEASNDGSEIVYERYKRIFSSVYDDMEYKYMKVDNDCMLIAEKG